jgi:hypothetical protein
VSTNNDDWKAFTERLTANVPANVYRAMELLQVRRARMEGGKPAIGTLYTEGARLLLEREGIPVEADPDALILTPPEPVKARPRRKKEAAA